MYLFLGMWQAAFVLSAMISAILLLHFMKSHRWGQDYKLCEGRLLIKGGGDWKDWVPHHQKVFWTELGVNHKCDTDLKYTRSSPFDHSRKRPALVTTTLVKPRLSCDLYLVMKSNCKRPRPLLGLPNWTFPLFLSSCKWPLTGSLLNGFEIFWCRSTHSCINITILV